MSEIDREWWWLDKKIASASVFEYTNTLRTLNKDRVERAVMYMDLYDGRAALSGSEIVPQAVPKKYPRENIVKSVVDTAMSLVASSLIRTAVLTRGANFSMQQKARGMEKCLDGLRAQQGGSKLKRTAIRDGMLTGTGILKSVKDYKRRRPSLERVTIDEFLADEQEAKHGVLMEAHQRFYADRFKLMRLYPERQADIEKANVPTLPDGSRTRKTTLVEVCESYRVPTEPGADDGRMGLFVEGVEEPLEWNVWKRDVPYVLYRWSPPTIGLFGVSLLDEVAGIQQSNDLFLERLEEILYQLAWPHRNVSQEDMADMEVKLVPGIGNCIPFKSTPSTVDAPRVLPPDLIPFIERRFEKAFRLAGVGEMAAHAKKPPDVRSQPALREITNIESKRFTINIQDGEEFQLAIDRTNIAAMKEMVAEGKGPLKVTWNGGDVVEELDWEKVNLEEDAYQLSIEAASMSSLTPAARKDLASDLFNVGAIDTTKYMKMIGLPDLEAEGNYLLEQTRHCDFIIEQLYLGKPLQPSKIEPLDELLPRVKAALWCAMDKGAPPDIVANINRYMVAAAKVQQELQAAAMAEAQAAQAQMAPPETTPVPLGGTGIPAMHAPMTGGR